MNVTLNVEFFAAYGTNYTRPWQLWADDWNGNSVGWNSIGTWLVPTSGGGGGGSGGDTTAPVISQVSAQPTTSTATIIWSTDDASTTQIRYRPSSSSTWAYMPASAEVSLVTSHGVSVAGLTANTQYSFEVLSANASNLPNSAAGIFATAPSSTPIRAVAPFPGPDGSGGGGPEPIIMSVNNNSVPIAQTLYCWNFSCLALTNCTISGNEALVSYSDQTAETARFTITATTLSQPGARYVTCYIPNGIVQSFRIQIYDTTPTISSFSPDKIFLPAIATPVTFTGKGFGYLPPTLTFSPGGVDYRIVPGTNTPTSFTVEITAPVEGYYAVTVVSKGNGFIGFQQGGPQTSTPTSAAVTLTAVRIRISEVSFGSDIPLQRDRTETSLTPVSDPVWRASNGPGDNGEVAYVRNRKMQISAKFTISPLLTTPITGVTVGADIPGIGKVEAAGQTLSGASYDFPATLSDVTLPNTTRTFASQPFNWRLSQGGTASYVSAGTSINTIYVTLAEPLAFAKPYFFVGPSGIDVDSMMTGGPYVPVTLLKLGIGTGGATSASEAIARTWASFSGPANVATWDLRPLTYYKAGVGFYFCSYNYLALITDAKPGGGQCGSFASLLMGSLAVNGVGSTLVRVDPTDPTCPVSGPPNCLAARLVVKNWFVNDPGMYPYEADFKWQVVTNHGDWMVPDRFGGEYGDWINVAGAAGQNSATPSEKIFDVHFVVKTGTPSAYYDPSYGRGPFLSARDLEITELLGYLRYFGDGDTSSETNWRARLVDGENRIRLTDLFSAAP